MFGKPVQFVARPVKGLFKHLGPSCAFMAGHIFFIHPGQFVFKFINPRFLSFPEIDKHGAKRGQNPCRVKSHAAPVQVRVSALRGFDSMYRNRVHGPECLRGWLVRRGVPRCQRFRPLRQAREFR